MIYLLAFLAPSIIFVTVRTIVTWNAEPDLSDENGVARPAERLVYYDLDASQFRRLH